MKPQELKQILKIAQSFNLKSLKVDGFEIVFDEKPQADKSPKVGGIPKMEPPKQNSQELLDAFDGGMPSDSDMLFYSADLDLTDTSKDGTT